MAIKPFNSVGGYSVGPNLTPFLDANNNANVANLTVNGTFGMTGNVQVGNLKVTGESNLNTLNVANAAVFSSTANVGNILTVTGNIDANGALLDVAGNLVVAGFANVTGILSVTANIDGAANLNITNNAVIGGTFRANGATTIDDTLTVNGVTSITGDTDVIGAFDVTGAATISSTLDVTGKTTLQAANIQGILGVEGEAVFSNTSTFTGDFITQGQATINSDLLINGGPLGASIVIDETDLTSNGNVILSGSNVSLGEAANLHIFGGSNGQYLRTLDSANGTVEWATVDTDTLANGTSNVDIPVANGNVLVAVGGTANIAVFSTGGTDFKGNVTVVDGVTANLLYANTLANVNALTVRGDANLQGELKVAGASNIANALTVTGAANLTNSLTVAGATQLNGAANIANTLIVTGAANIANTLQVTGDTTIGVSGTPANLLVYGDANVRTDLIVGGKANITGTSNVTGAADFGDTVTVTGATTLNGTANINNTLGVTGAATFDSTVDIGLKLTVSDDAEVTGLLEVGGNIDGGINLNLIGDANIRDLGARGDADIAGTFNANGAATFGDTLGVTGAVTLSNTLSVANGATFSETVDVTGAVTLGNNLSVAGWANVAGNLQFVNGNGTSVTLSTGVTTANLSANGANVSLGQVANLHILGGANGQILSTDGSGNLSWTSTANINQITNGTSNVKIATADGNVTVSANGQANIISVTSNGTFATTTITNDVLITGNITVQGNTTQIDTTTLNVEDPVITEGRGPNNAPLTLNDGVDRGLYSYYYVGPDGAGTEKGAFVGYKNAGAFAGSYIIASDATIADNVIGVNTYANVVVSGIISGPAGNTAGGVSRIDMGTGADISFRVDGEDDVLNITADDITANANVAISGQLAVSNGNISVGSGSATGTAINIMSDGVNAFSSTTIASAATVTDPSATNVLANVQVVAGRAVEFFVTAKVNNGDGFETGKYLAVTDGTGNVDFTSYGQVRIGNVPGTVAVVAAGTGPYYMELQVTAGGNITSWTTQYQVIGY